MERDIMVRAGRGGGLEVKHDQNWGGQLSGLGIAFDPNAIAKSNNRVYEELKIIWSIKILLVIDTILQSFTIQPHIRTTLSQNPP
jgi:hypothetical protein